MKKKELTVSELGRMFELFSKAHPECPFMKMEFGSFLSGNGIRPAIRYGLGGVETYISSYSTRSVEELYEMMKNDVKDILNLE